MYNECSTSLIYDHQVSWMASATAPFVYGFGVFRGRLLSSCCHNCPVTLMGTVTASFWDICGDGYEWATYYL
jgi:hypothetical protein